MAGFANIGGVWRPMKPLKCNIGGAWKTIQTVKVCVGGVWKSGFTNTLVFNNFLDTSVFTATRKLSLSGRDITADKDRNYVLKAESSRLYIYYRIRSDTARGSISIKTVSPIDFTGYSKVTLTNAHCVYLNTDYTDEDDGPMSCKHSISMSMGIVAPGSTTYTKSITKSTSAGYQKRQEETFENVTLDVSDVKGSYYLQVVVSLDSDNYSNSSSVLEGYATGPITIS